jgi:hypothetical protein
MEGVRGEDEDKQNEPMIIPALGKDDEEREECVACSEPNVYACIHFLIDLIAHTRDDCVERI